MSVTLGGLLVQVALALIAQRRKIPLRWVIGWIAQGYTVGALMLWLMEPAPGGLAARAVLVGAITTAMLVGHWFWRPD